jgi:hypothetical protein
VAKITSCAAVLLLLTVQPCCLLGVYVRAAFPNVQSVKVLRDRQTGNSKGIAFVVST